VQGFYFAKKDIFLDNFERTEKSEKNKNSTLHRRDFTGVKKFKVL